MGNDEQASGKPDVNERALLMATLHAAPLVASAAFYPFLPDVVVTHYRITMPDAWGPKAWKLVVPGALCTGANALMRLILALVKKGRPSREAREEHQGA